MFHGKHGDGDGLKTQLRASPDHSLEQTFQDGGPRETAVFSGLTGVHQRGSPGNATSLLVELLHLLPPS